MSKASRAAAAAAAADLIAQADATAQAAADTQAAASIGIVDLTAQVDAIATDAPATDAPATDAPATDAPDAPATDAPAPVTKGASRTYTCLREHNQLGSERHFSFAAGKPGIVYVPASMFQTPPSIGVSLTLTVSDVVVPGHTMVFRSITGKDMRRRYGVAGHKGSIVIHASQLPAFTVEPTMLVSSLPFATPPDAQAKHVVDTASVVAAAALRIAQAAGRALPTQADVDAAHLALGLTA